MKENKSRKKKNEVFMEETEASKKGAEIEVQKPKKLLKLKHQYCCQNSLKQHQFYLCLFG